MKLVRRPGFAIAMTTGLVIGALTGLWGASDPVPSRIVIIVGAALMGLFLVSAVVDGALVGHGPRWYWPVLVLITALAATAYVQQWPLQGRWAASEGPFEHFVSGLPELGGLGSWQSPQSTPAPGRIGLYGIDQVGILPNAYLFVTDTGGGQSAGFVYLPDGPDSAPGDLGYEFTHLDGPWYAFVQTPP